MSYRDTVLYVAYQELAKPVHWKKYEDRILDYFLVSTGVKVTKEKALEVSWCSYFVHWCLHEGGMHPLPKVGAPGMLGSMGSIGRFMKPFGGIYEAYGVASKKYRPMPGDMYYRPKPNDHIGFISEVRDAKKGSFQIRSIDGNSGPLGHSSYFDMSHGKKIGYGFIYQPTGWKSLGNDCFYIKLCDETAY